MCLIYFILAVFTRYCKIYFGFNIFSNLYCLTNEISSSLMLLYSSYLMINRKKEIDVNVFLLFIPIPIIFILLSYYFTHKAYLAESFVECCINQNISNQVYIINLIQLF